MLTVLLLTLAPTVASAADVSVEASVSSSVVNLGDTLRLEVRASIDANTGIRVAEKPRVGSAFQIVGTGRRPKIVIRNGSAHRSLTLTYRLRAKEKGTYELSPGAFDIGGQRYEAEPQKIRVVESGAAGRGDDQPGAQARSEDGNIMLDASVEPTRKPYLGEQVTVVYSLLHDPHRANVNPRPPDEPSLQNFWIEELSRKLAGDSKMRRVDGRPMKSTILRAYALFPLQDGAVTIEPLGVTVRSGGLFGGSESIDLQTKPIELEVQPLPDGAPDNFYEGNVGSWDFRLEVEETSASVGDSVTVEMVASGSGNVRRLEVPSLEGKLDGFHISGRDEEVDRQFRGTRVTGRKTVTYTLVPTREGQLEIPPIQFAYFDPDSETYETVDTDPHPIRVSGGTLPDGLADDDAGRDSSGKAGGDDETSPREQLRDELRTPIRNLDRAGGSALLRVGFWIGAGLPLAAIVVLLAWGPLRRRLREARSGRKRSRTFERARTRLDEADPQSPDEASDIAYDALRIALVDGLDLPAGALSPNDLEPHLERIECPEPLRDDLTDILTWCESSRYAPDAGTDRTETEEWLEKLRAALDRLAEKRRDGDITAASQVTVISVAAAFTAIVAAPAPLVGAEGDSVERGFDRALQHHDAQKYGKAADAWRPLTEEAPTNAAIWHNYASSLVQTGDLGRARLAIERAARLAPHHGQIDQTLNRIRRLVALERLEQAPERAQMLELEANVEWWKLAASTSSSPLAIGLIIALWLLAGGLALRRFGRRIMSRSLGTVLAAAGLLGVLAVSGAWLARTRVLKTTHPAIVVESPTVYEAPSEHASRREVLPPLLPGTMVDVIERRDDWVRVDLRGGDDAWLPTDTLEALEIDD
jgi:tetratricopeptide (TPR) repeat protein